MAVDDSQGRASNTHDFNTARILSKEPSNTETQDNSLSKKVYNS